MKASSICKNYFSGIQTIAKFKQNNAKTNAIAILEIFTYFTVIIPLFFGIAYAISSLIDRISQNPDTEQTKKTHGVALQTLQVRPFSFLSNETQNRLQRASSYLEGLAQTRCSRFSGIVLIGVGDQILIREQYQPPDPIQKPFNSNSPWNIDSIGKLFTAVAILQLMEREKEALETPIVDILDSKEDFIFEGYFRELFKINENDLHAFRTHKPPITLSHLLTHSSGLVDGIHTEKGSSETRFNPSLIGEYRYSNTGFGLLAKIIEKKSGLTFTEYVKENVLRPCGITDQGSLKWIDHSPSQNEIANGFNTLAPSGKITPFSEPHQPPYGNGCFWMLPEDLFKFARALQQGTLFIKGTVTKHLMFDKSLGIGADKQYDLIVAGHSGASPGGSSDLMILEKENDPQSEPITSIVFSNFSAGKDAATELKLSMIATDRDLPSPFEPQLRDIEFFHNFLNAEKKERNALSKKFVDTPMYIVESFVNEYFAMGRVDLCVDLLSHFPKNIIANLRDRYNESEEFRPLSKALQQLLIEL